MYRFNPKSDKELDEMLNFSLLADGEYPFKILKVEETVSSKGNPMLVVKLLLTLGNDSRTITDYLMESMPHKLKHFFESIGMHRYYEKGEIDINALSGLGGVLKLGLQKGAAKPDGSGNWPDKNQVKDYVKTAFPAEIKEAFKDTSGFDDVDIPF
jgi:hypothetical protein